MRLTVFLVNTICRPINALLALADRDVCRWAQDTDEDAREVSVESYLRRLESLQKRIDELRANRDET